MATTRALEANKVVQDQVDLFYGDFFTRIPNLTVGDLTMTLFYDNTLVAWPLVTGAAVGDAQVVAGNVYFHQITGAPGYYALRFRPNIPGYWRVVVSYSVAALTLALDYDIYPPSGSCGGGGLQATFV